MKSRRWIVGLVLAATLCVCAGCPEDDPRVEMARDKITVIAASIEAAEPVVAELEKLAPGIPIEVVEKGEAAANKVEIVCSRASTAAKIFALIPGATQPFAAGAAAILGALGTLAGAVGTFFQRRKAASIAKAAVIAAEKTKGGGAAIVNASTVAGVDAAIRAALGSAIAGGDLPR